MDLLNLKIILKTKIGTQCKCIIIPNLFGMFNCLFPQAIINPVSLPQKRGDNYELFSMEMKILLNCMKKGIPLMK
jgi:hypothetical protein